MQCRYMAVPICFLLLFVSFLFFWGGVGGGVRELFISEIKCTC